MQCPCNLSHQSLLRWPRHESIGIVQITLWRDPLLWPLICPQGRVDASRGCVFEMPSLGHKHSLWMLSGLLVVI